MLRVLDSSRFVDQTGSLSAAPFNTLTHLVRIKHAYFVQALRRHCPRILLVGDSGLGKSSLVNTVFSLEPERGGAEVQAGGRPCSQNFAQYGPTDEILVRLVDSKGVEKLTASGQLEGLRSFVADAAKSSNELDHIHLCWYFVGDRWQVADKLLVTELLKTCLVIVILSKRDQRGEEWARNTRAAIKADLGDVPVADVGDPRGTRNWIPQSCALAHGAAHIDLNLRSKTWQCTFELRGQSADAGVTRCPCHGNNSPFGHRELVQYSLELLPLYLCYRNHTGELLEIAAKHVDALAVICGFSTIGAGVGAFCRFSVEFPLVLTMEYAMATALVSIYGVSVEVFDFSELTGPEGGRFTTGAVFLYFLAKVLKVLTWSRVSGSTLDMVGVAASIAMLGIAMCRVLTRLSIFETPDPEKARLVVKEIANRPHMLSAARGLSPRGSPSDGAGSDPVNMMAAIAAKEHTRTIACD